MTVSDALVIGEDWISEHYFTSSGAKETFRARVLARRQGWDAQESATTRTRFVAARESLLRRFAAHGEVVEQGGRVDVDAARALFDELVTVLGYRTGQWSLDAQGPLLRVGQASLTEEAAPLVVLAATPVATVDALVAKKEPTLLEPWLREGHDPVESVAVALSTLLTDVDGPAFALVLAGRWALVAERERWPEGRWLAVDLQLVAERNDTRKAGEIDTALACLDAESLAPDAAGGLWWRATLEESVKHTVGVSKDLQEGVRTSIEIIANDVVHRRRAQGLPPLAADQADELAKQALRYLYRILFLLYAEASPELGVLPVGAGEYDAGYGLDRLRDLALVELHDPREQQGTHLYESLATLFRLVDEGHEPGGDPDLPQGLEFQGLRADLFAPSATAHVDEVRLGNAALLRVLGLLLLSNVRAKGGRGFISYVELGINQLGAVYEGLMSYTGSFATQEMYEVAKDGDPSKGSWVVATHQAQELAEHLVRRPDPVTGEQRPVVHQAGEFVFRLSGRDRQRSASYYTPEVLTRFTVQQALEELLDQDGTTTPASDILSMTVCEPALGSGAFAIEAVRQLAEEYLSRRERELGERIDPQDRPAQVQKVKAHIALHQVYGVDLNATAVELAEVSLWLDTMVAGLRAPWFGLRLRRGNSLVGARRARYAPATIADKSWLTSVPVDDPMTTLAAVVDGTAEQGARVGPPGVHHFLLPAAGWGSALEVPKLVRDLVPDAHLKALKAWRSGVKRKPTAVQVKRAQALAQRVEVLWGMALRRLRVAEQESSRAIEVWGREPVEQRDAVTREQIEASLADENGAYRRLRLVMDLWCALWYWPLTELDVAPPTVDEWLTTCELILGFPPKQTTKTAWMDLLTAGDGWDHLARAEEQDLAFAFAKDVAAVREAHPWVVVGERVAAQQAFFHWELDFATVFARGGFDLQVGNPPWVRPDVNIEELLAEGDPWWAVAHKPSEAEKAERRPATLKTGGVWRSLIDSSAEVAVLAAVLGDTALYPIITSRPDLYRAFMSQVWRHGSTHGISALIHLESHFTDDKAQSLRREAYRRLRRHWQFINELSLFEIQHQKVYGVNIYGSAGTCKFLHATSLYHPETVVRSLAHDGSGEEPGFKGPDGGWDTRPHRGRLQSVTADVLAVWADILGSAEPSSTAMVYSVNSAAARTLSSMSLRRRLDACALFLSAGWNETTDRQRGRFVSAWGPSDWQDAILQGSHLGVGTAFYKSPNPTMLHNTDWTLQDQEALTVGALPVTAYKPAGSRLAYDTLYGSWRWTDEDGIEHETRVRDHHRVAWRAMAANTGERTLISALIPPGAGHVHGVNSVGIPSHPPDVVATSGMLSSLLADFAVRSAPRSAITIGVIRNLPAPPAEHPLLPALVLRTLRLNCVTDAYADLWAQCWDSAFLDDAPILARFDERPVGPQWSADTPLRRAVDRRNAQVEIDALVALMLGVPVADLCTIYRTQFAVLYGYDHREYTYDANGRLVPNSVLSVWRKRGEPQDPALLSVAERTATHPGSGIDCVYELPFAIRDREADFRTAYAAFEHRLTTQRGSTT